MYITSVYVDNFGFIIAETSDESKPTSFVYKKGVGGQYNDEYGNQMIFKQGEVTIISDKIRAGHSSYTLKDLYNDIIDEISKSTVTTALGVQPLLNALQIQNLKIKVQKLLT